MTKNVPAEQHSTVRRRTGPTKTNLEVPAAMSPFVGGVVVVGAVEVVSL